ncbi:MAG: DUF5009 domain-containing protein [Ignavibacteriales bacterium]|nr:DUF5009 domain-containing protein [Ignavibacteriales bacterium]
MEPTKSGRLLSLDVFRGITIMGMILVNNPGTWSVIYPPLKHAAWHGCTPTDWIFPFFLFIVGVAVTLSLSKRKEQGTGMVKLYGKIFYRAGMLFLLGLVMAGFWEYDLSTIRIPGVLQRIGVVYLITAILFLNFNFKTLTYIGISFLLIYWFAMTLIPVPGVGYANLEPTTNLAAWLDNLLLNGHLWSGTKVWDPEGILSTIPAISTCLMGVLTGYLLRSQKDDKEKVLQMFAYGIGAIVIGYIWDIFFPFNKSIWTSSYVMYTGGLALVFLAMCYYLIDMKGYKWWIKPFQVYGMNAITVFFASGIVGRLLFKIKVAGPDGNPMELKTYIFNNYFLSWLEPINASLAYAIVFILIWLGLMWILYAKKIFIKI